MKAGKIVAMVAAGAAVGAMGTVAVVKAGQSGPRQAEITVAAVEGLARDFALGADVSSVLSLEASGVVFRDASGKEADLFALLADAGVTDVRVRVWNDPYDEQGRGYGGGTVDVERAVKIGKRATAAGMGVLVDFHYSDFWADPGKQMSPKAWEGLSPAERAAAAGEFSREALTAMRDAGVDVRMVQVGNETNNGVAGLTAWPDMCALFSAGAAAVREVFPDARVAIHFANPEREGEYARYAKILANYEVDYDVFASSYYPFWHGSLENLQTVLSEISQEHGKEVMVAETSWVYTLGDHDGQPNVIGSPELATNYAISPQGQADAFRDVVAAVSDIGGIGVYYWEPAWLPVGPPDDLAGNRELWNRDGSGWASEYSSDYDPDDAGVHWGGSGWDNQALFAPDGTALPSLRMFEYVRTGAVAPLAVARVQTVRVEAPLGGDVVMPDTATVHYNDRSTADLPVAWGSLPDTSVEAVHEVEGQLEDGTPVRAIVSVRVPNLLANPGFEDDDLSMWAFESEARTFRVVADNVPAAIDERVVNFWSDEAYDFTLSQRIEGAAPGAYEVRVSVHGADVRDPSRGLVLVVRGSEGEWSVPLVLDGWLSWHEAVIPDAVIGADGVLIVSVEGALGPDDWGFIDGFVVTPAAAR